MRQFSLLQLAEWTVGVAFVVAALSGCHTKVAWHYTFTTVPADITALESWVESEISATATVRLAEDENRVYIRDVQKRFLGFNASFPQPPWKELGFGRLQGASFSYRGRAFQFTPLMIVTGITFIFIFGFLRWQNQKAKT